MKVEFLKDENGFIWLFYARDISCRKNKNNKDLNSKEAKAKSLEIQANKVKMRNQMVTELEQYENQFQQKRSKATKDMLNMMNSYYRDLKNDVGVEE